MMKYNFVKKKVKIPMAKYWILTLLSDSFLPFQSSKDHHDVPCSHLMCFSQGLPLLFIFGKYTANALLLPYGELESNYFQLF